MRQPRFGGAFSLVVAAVSGLVYLLADPVADPAAWFRQLLIRRFNERYRNRVSLNLADTPQQTLFRYRRQ